MGHLYSTVKLYFFVTNDNCAQNNGYFGMIDWKCTIHMYCTAHLIWTLHNTHISHLMSHEWARVVRIEFCDRFEIHYDCRAMADLLIRLCMAHILGKWHYFGVIIRSSRSGLVWYSKREGMKTYAIDFGCVSLNIAIWIYLWLPSTWPLWLWLTDWLL